jgi:multimeric flavodoxin WrbA
MRVVAINGSPKGAASNTAVMIRSLLNGFSSNGDSVTDILLSEKSIHYCSGCYSCWSQTPGVCVHKDDMKSILAQMHDANVLIIGSPLYFNNVSGTLKVFFDRLTAAGGDPHEKPANAENKAAPRYVMVSNCGYPVRNQFDIVSLWINRVAAMTQSAVIAEFYTTTGKVLTSPTEEQSQTRANYLEYLKGCGRCLSQNMKLNGEHLALSQRNILDFN